MTYIVKYKKIGSFFWQSIKNVKGDGFIEGGFTAGPNNQAIGATKDIRWFVLDDETRIEIPVSGLIFKFSPGRFLHIKNQMERESGQRM
jgi:hypothetical protein